MNNTIQNLAAKGRTFDFGFLWNRAGYDINQTLIPYTNDSTHFRALLVGLVNTLVVAFIGCIFATVLGVIIGVLRLSKNWLIGRMTRSMSRCSATCRCCCGSCSSFVILTETTPSPRDFRVTEEMTAAGESPTASMFLNGCCRDHQPGHERARAAVRAGRWAPSGWANGRSR